MRVDENVFRALSEDRGRAGRLFGQGVHSNDMLVNRESGDLRDDIVVGMDEGAGGARRVEGSKVAVQAVSTVPTAAVEDVAAFSR